MTTGSDNGFETYYFMVNENHLELSRNNTFSFPTIMRRVPTNVNDTGSNHRNVVDPTSLSREDIMNCRDRSWCLRLIGNEVTLLPETTSGYVVAFKYEGNIISEQRAVWTVKYYNDQRRSAIVTKVLKFWELKIILILLD